MDNDATVLLNEATFMAMRSLHRIALAGFLGLASACQPDDTRATATGPATAVPARAETRRAASASPAALPPALQQAIRQDVASLDAVRAWSGVRKKRLFDSTEGGEAVFYTLGGELRKVFVHRLSETGQYRGTYYLRAGRPAFVEEENHTYNRPIAWDSAAMREARDTQVFDPGKSVITTIRSYFDATGLLVAQQGPRVPDSLAIPNYLAREQRRLRTEMAALLKPE